MPPYLKKKNGEVDLCRLKPQTLHLVLDTASGFSAMSTLTLGLTQKHLLLFCFITQACAQVNHKRRPQLPFWLRVPLLCKASLFLFRFLTLDFTF